MPNDILTLNLDLGIGELSGFGERLEREMAKAAAKLTAMTYEHIKQQAQSKLKSSLQTYLDSLQAPEALDYTTWQISLLKKGMWIEEGLDPDFDMLPGFLKSPKAKEGKNGKYLIVPFKHNKKPAVMTVTQNTLKSAVEQFLKTAGPNKTAIPYKNLEKGPGGAPIIGKLHTFNLNLKQSAGLASKHSGLPLLHGLNIYQKPVEQTNKKGDKISGVQKDMMTFRTASESQAGKGMWMHPGFEGKKFFESSLDWASTKWENEIKNEVLKALGLKDA